MLTVYCAQLHTCMPPSLLIRGRRQQSLLVSMLTCRTGLSSPTLLRSISAGTRTSRRRALRAQSSGSRELQTPASPRPRAAKRWVRRVSKRSARAQIQSPGSFFARHGTLTQWFPEQKSPSFLHVPEDASMGTASRCWTIVFAPAVSASIECTISLRFVCVLTSATIKSAPPIMFFFKYFQKWSTQLVAPLKGTRRRAR